jgi:hypothetical protein
LTPASRIEPDAATLSLLDTEPGACPAGHGCEFGPGLGEIKDAVDPIGARQLCRTCDFISRDKERRARPEVGRLDLDVRPRSVRLERGDVIAEPIASLTGSPLDLLGEILTSMSAKLSPLDAHDPALACLTKPTKMCASIRTPFALAEAQTGPDSPTPCIGTLDEDISKSGLTRW